jgi:hypothetical protein
VNLQPASRIEHGATVDGSGRAFCLSCAPFDKASWHDANSLVGVCDGCGREFVDCVPLEISGLAMIEYPQCKIF